MGGRAELGGPGPPGRGWGVLDLLVEAAYTRRKLALLEQANLRLQKLRFLARLCKDRRCLSLGQYEFAARTINEIGTDLGGWIRQQRGRERDLRTMPADSA